MGAISDNIISIILTYKGHQVVRKGHPWLYDKAVERMNKQGNSGDIAILYDSKRQFAGIGLYDAHSPIVVRVLHSGKQIILDKEWLTGRISASIDKRAKLINDPQTTGYRLVNGENDALAGVVADIYDTTLVIKLDSTCWLPHLETLKDIFIALIKPERIVLRMSRTVKEFSDIPDGSVVFGNKISKPVTFFENGIKFYADPVEGQKTGFFLDQRDNRKLVGDMSEGLSVLNIFAYTGGFSLYAAQGGAKKVASLDISKPALDECVQNYELNGFTTPHEIICGDAFEEMERLSAEKRKFGMAIVDPPSFARKQPDVPGALKAYEKLNKLAVKLIEQNGILVAASCSARVSKDEFFTAVINAVKASGRRYSEIKRTAHAIDHPIGFPEGAYLKCIFIKMD